MGPIGVLCIQRSLRNGFKSGFMTGMGAATADGFYGLIAAFGLTAMKVIDCVSGSIILAFGLWSLKIILSVM